MIKLIIGDLLTCDANILAHQVNCMGVMGGGIAKQVKEKYPVAFDKYIDFIKNTKDTKLLGKVQIVEVAESQLPPTLKG